ncbi:MAG: DUF4833 domain-containing protein [Oligoflexia bacterium]|nr:DUF4833 domain-containing protein [Oligoflexia bacterium]
MSKIFIFFISIFSVLFFSLSAIAKDAPLFSYSKNYHPKNILYFNVVLEDDCSISTNNPFNIYWIMGHRGNRTEAMNRLEVKMLKPRIVNQSPYELTFTNKVLSDHKNISRPEVTIFTSQTQKGCYAYASMYTDYGYIKLKNIYVDIKTILGIPSPTPRSIQFTGIDDSGVERKIVLPNN